MPAFDKVEANSPGTSRGIRQRMAVGIAALLGSLLLGGGMFLSTTPAAASSTYVGYRSASAVQCAIPGCAASDLHLAGSYQYNGSQAVFTSIHYWTDGRYWPAKNQWTTWCGASPGNTIGCNWTVQYSVLVPVGGDIAELAISVNYYIRIQAHANGTYSWWQGISGWSPG